VTQGREALALLRAGAVKGLSIGYKTIKEQWDATRKVRLLKEVKLYEVSVVTFPANELATVEAVSGVNNDKSDEGAVLEALRDIRQSKDLAAASRELRSDLAAKRGRAA